MNEAVKRKIVFYTFIVLAVVVLCLGVLLAVYNYEESMKNKDSVLRDWKLHTCCCGTCEYSDEELEIQYIIMTATISLTIAMGALALAIWLYNKRSEEHTSELQSL